jgi:hypothetical protein
MLAWQIGVVDPSYVNLLRWRMVGPSRRGRVVAVAAIRSTAWCSISDRRQNTYPGDTSDTGIIPSIGPETRRASNPKCTAYQRGKTCASTKI